MVIVVGYRSKIEWFINLVKTNSVSIFIWIVSSTQPTGSLEKRGTFLYTFISTPTIALSMRVSTTFLSGGFDFCPFVMETPEIDKPTSSIGTVSMPGVEEPSATVTPIPPPPPPPVPPPRDALGREYHSIRLLSHLFNIPTQYTKLKLLGAGSYGPVCSAQDAKSGRRVAIKQLRQGYTDRRDFLKKLSNELQILKTLLGHVNIATLLEYTEWPLPEKGRPLKQCREVYIVMKCFETDMNRIIRSTQTLTNEHVRLFGFQLICGLAYAHSAGVVHRDVKPANLLVNSNCALVLTDFGFSRQTSRELRHMTEYAVTRWYRPPEITCESRVYNEASDMWSVGCILAELILRKPLLSGDDNTDQLRLILSLCGKPDESVFTRYEFPIGAVKFIQKETITDSKTIRQRLHPHIVDDQLVDLLERLLVFDPDVRLTASEALKHPYFGPFMDTLPPTICPQKYKEWEQSEDAIRKHFVDLQYEIWGIETVKGDKKEMGVDEGGDGDGSDTCPSRELDMDRCHGVRVGTGAHRYPKLIRGRFYLVEDHLCD